MAGTTQAMPRRMVGRGLLASLFVVVMLVCVPVAGFSADVPIATIPVGDSPVAVGVNPFSHRVFVANYYGNSVSVIDGASDTVTSTVSTGDWSIPIAVVANPLATPARAYVAEFWGNQITVIDETSNNATAVVASNGVHAGGPRALALDPSGSAPRLYVADYGSANVTVFDALTYSQVTAIPVGDQPRAMGIFVSLPRTRVYVANRGSSSVSVIDGATNQVVATLPVGAAPKAIAVDNSTGYAYVTCEESNEVWVIDDSDSVTATVDVGSRPVGIAVDESAGRVFVGNFNEGTVSVLRTSDFSHEATLTVGTQPWAIAFDAGDGKAYVTNYGSGTVSVIDSTLSVSTVAAGTGPYAVAVDEGATPHKAYVGNWGSDNVTVIDEPPLSATLGALAVEEVYATDDAVIVTIDAGLTLENGSYFSEGTATSIRPAYPASVEAVFYRLDGSDPWQRAEISTGGGTTEIGWRAELGELVSSEVFLEVLAVDQTSAAASVSDGGTSVRTSSAGGAAQATLSIHDEPLETVTSLSVLRPTKPSKPYLQAAVNCTDDASAASGTVVFERLVDDTWAEEGRAELDGGVAGIFLEKRPAGTFRARFLGNESFAPSVSEQVYVSASGREKK